MIKDAKFAIIYALVVAAVTFAYVNREDIGLLGHAKATPTQVEADDE